MSKKQWSQAWMALGLAWELGWTIAIPVVALSLIGKYLDVALGRNFLFIIIGGILGIVTAVYLVYKKADRIHQKMINHERKSRDN